MTFNIFIRFASFYMILSIVSYLGLLSFTRKALTLLQGDYTAKSLKTGKKECMYNTQALKTCPCSII